MKVSIVLDEQEQNELRIILTDKDGAAALSFLGSTQIRGVKRASGQMIVYMPPHLGQAGRLQLDVGGN